MFDTVRATTVQNLDSGFLQRFATCEQRMLPGGAVKRRWFYNSQEDLFRMTYHEQDQRIVLEVSLPRLIVGHNAALLVDPALALSEWDKLKDRYLPSTPTMSDWVASRVDCCWEFSVGDNLQSYISAMLSLTMPRHKTVTWFGQSVEWHSTSHSFGFYNKAIQLFDVYHDSSLAERAKGLLRVETRIDGAGSVQRTFGQGKGAILEDVLNPRFAYIILSRDLERVKVNTLISTQDVLADMLVETVGMKDACDLFGFVFMLVRCQGKDNLIKSGFPRATVYRYLNKLKQAGISPTILNTDTGQVDIKPQVLEPLVLPGFDDILQAAGCKGLIEPEEIKQAGWTC